MKWFEKLCYKHKNGDEIKKENNKQKNTNLELDKKVLGIVMPIVVISILIAIMDLVYKLTNYQQMQITAGGVFCALIICYCLYLILFSITNKSVLSLSSVTILVIVVNVINQIKISYMREPVYFSDIEYLKNIGEIFKMVDNTFFTTIKQYIPAGIVLVLALTLVIYVLVKSNIDIKIESKKVRVMLFVFPTLILTLLFVPYKTTNRIYLNLFFGVNDRQNYAYITSNVDYYSKYGVIGGMYGQVLESRIYEPDEYNEEELKNILANVQEKRKKDELSIGTPNIIVILSESFWDISVLDEIKFDKEVTPNFNSLKEQGLLFEMVSPSYGGTTANVEMEILTGFNLSYYTKGYIPYLQLYDETMSKIPSIVKELNNNGYTTKITSCTSKEFYNREEVYTNLGVQERIYLNNVDSKYYKGQYLSDEYLTDKIIEDLENKENNKKLFSMTLTIQQHMPYTYEKYDKYDIEIVESSLNQKMEETVHAYAQGVYDADKELGRLYDYIQNFDEPTIIIFFGDHLPYLNTANGNDVFSKLNYFNTEDELLNNYRKYNTQALVIANYDIKDEGVKYISPDLLMPYLLNRMDLNLSSYYRWLDTTRLVLPSYNYLLAIDKNGRLYNAKNIQLESDMKKLYLLREKMQYMLYIK